MDGNRAAAAMSEGQKLAVIKQQMPGVYAAIQAQAQVLGNGAFALVRRGLRGEPGCFWACEAGWVMGTPFKDAEAMRDVGRYMAAFGCAYVCMWPPVAVSAVSAVASGEVAHGTA